MFNISKDLKGAKNITKEKTFKRPELKINPVNSNGGGCLWVFCSLFWGWLVSWSEVLLCHQAGLENPGSVIFYLLLARDWDHAMHAATTPGGFFMLFRNSVDLLNVRSDTAKRKSVNRKIYIRKIPKQLRDEKSEAKFSGIGDRESSLLIGIQKIASRRPQVWSPVPKELGWRINGEIFPNI